MTNSNKNNWWLKFGCFLTGYNYEIMKNSSEASAKAVKKYTSAILIVSVIWGFIGFTFANRYLQLDTLGSTISAIIMIFIVIQIEKQIILNVGKNKLASAFRIAIALVMAILGSIIIDQIIFKDDIEIEKEFAIIERVNKSLPNKVRELDNEIIRIDSLLSQKNNERTLVIKEVSENPTIKMPEATTIRKPIKKDKIIVDENGKSNTIKVDTIVTEKTYVNKSILNPKRLLIPKLDTQIKNFQEKRDILSSKKISIREDLESQFKNQFGFLDELEIMKKIIFESNVAFLVWGLWFSFLVLIELFVVSSKWGKGNDTDYDMIILHQRDVKIEAIKKLKNQVTPVKNNTLNKLNYEL